MTGSGDLDAVIGGLSAESLFDAGHLKWTIVGPGKLGAFVAEMDFGTAPPVTAALHDAVDRDARSATSRRRSTRRCRTRARRGRPTRYGWAVDPGRRPPAARRAHGPRDRDRRTSRRPGAPVILPTPAYMPFLDVPAPPRAARRSRSRWSATATGTCTTSTRSTRAFAAGGDLLVLCNPHNPLGRVLERDELDGHRRGRRPPRRARVLRRDPRPARLPRPRARPVRVAVGDDRRPHRHRDVGVEGVEPGRPEVRPADRHATTPTAQRWRRSAPYADQRRVDARRGRQHRRVHATAGRGSTTSSPTSTATAGCSPSSSPSTCPTSATRRPRARTWRGSTAARLGLPDDAGRLLPRGRPTSRSSTARGAARRAAASCGSTSRRAAPILEQMVDQMAAAVGAATPSRALRPPQRRRPEAGAAPRRVPASPPARADRAAFAQHDGDTSRRAHGHRRPPRP